MTASARKRIEELEEKVEALTASIAALLSIAGIDAAPEDPFRAAFGKFRERAAEQTAHVLR